MKKRNRFAAIAAAAALLTFTAVPMTSAMMVSAEVSNNCTLSIGGVGTEAHTFDLYQIMTGEYTYGEDATHLNMMTWGNGVTTYTPAGEGATAVTANGVVDPVILKEITNAETAEQKAALISRFVLDENNKTTQTAATTVTFNNLTTGYYLVKDVTTIGESSSDATSSDILVYVNGTKEVTIKSVKPSFDKKVATSVTAGEGDDAAPTYAWDEVADYAIGDTVTFQLTTTIPQSIDLKSYGKYKLVFTDTYSDGITFGEITSVTYKTSADTAPVAINTAEGEAAGYVYAVTQKEVTSGTEEETVTTNVDNGFTITIDDLTNIIPAENWGLTDDSTIEVVVTYTGTLNNKAPSIGETKTAEYAAEADITRNTAYISYSNNPANSTSIGTSTPDNVGVFTYQFTSTKYANFAQTGYELSGAKFTLHRDNGGEIADETISVVYDDTLHAYRPVMTDETGVEYMITGFENTDGKLDIVGLDAGTYWLKEDVPPEGYTPIENLQFTIGAALSEAADDLNATAELTLSSNLTLGEGETFSLTGNNLIDVLSSDKTLPSTGGIGTTIFYIVGSMMVAGAGIVLITKKRANLIDG